MQIYTQTGLDKLGFDFYGKSAHAVEDAMLQPIEKYLCYNPIYLDKASMHLFLHEKISFMMHDFLTAFYWRDVVH